LKSKEVDLTNLALDIARKNAFSKELIERLEKLQVVEKDKQENQLKDTIRFVNNHLSVGEDLALLQENIVDINQRFYEKLDDQFENLSSNDKYMLGLIRLNLSNKEIATIKGISPGSAKVLRYRLRKKLNLTPDVDFATFLREL
ncbi:MAG: LuxR C-terminal-related transcriptional regulator, partial [Bacteroidota bacterium]